VKAKVEQHREMGPVDCTPKLIQQTTLTCARTILKSTTYTEAKNR
jgi:hypothetical protein